MTVAGKHGMAEEMFTPQESPILARSLITSKLWHPTYTQFMLVLVHLRDHPEFGVANRVSPDSTHALSSLTLAPNGVQHDGTEFVYLRPINFEVQFIAEDDAMALRIHAQCVQRVLDGHLNPESGQAQKLNGAEWQQAVDTMLGLEP